MIGQTVLITLKNESYMGDVVLVNEKSGIITLENIRDNKTGTLLNGRQRFYKLDIVSIKVLKEYDSLSDSSLMSSSYTSFNSSNALSSELSKFEYHYCENVVKNAIYIYQVDEKYHKAINDINKRSYVSLMAEGINMGRNSKITILTFATEDYVYVFDFICLGSIFKDLKIILESHFPLKIVHNSASISDYLKYCHKITLGGVFDTFVADIILNENGYEGLEFNKSLNKYLGYSLMDSKEINWLQRPFDNQRKFVTSRKAIYLIKLYEYILVECLKNLYGSIFNFEKIFIQNMGSLENSIAQVINSSEKVYDSLNSDSNIQNYTSDNDEDYSGKILVLELEHGTFVGKCTHFNNTKFNMEHVIEASTGLKLPGRQIFQKQNVISIRTPEFSKPHLEGFKTEKCMAPKEMLTFPKKTKINNISFSKLNEEFNSAVFDLQSKSIITFDFNGNYLSLATENCIYSFNLKALEFIPNNLRCIIEKEKPLKLTYIPYESLQDLKLKFDLKLNSWLDVFVAHAIVSRNANILDFDQCAKEYFEFPEEVDEDLNDNKIYCIRKLFWKLQPHLFEDLYSKFETCLDIYRKNTNWAEVSIKMSQQRMSDLIKALTLKAL